MSFNPRIKELPPLSIVDDSMIIPLYDYLTDTTYYTTLANLKASNSNDYRWDSLNTYGDGEIVTYLGLIWESQSAGNLNNVPFTGSTFWIEQSPSNGGLSPWQAGVYVDPNAVVVSNITGKFAAYKLAEAAPFNSSDFLAELLAHSWVLLDEVDLHDYSVTVTNVDLDCLGGVELRLKKQNIGGDRVWTMVNHDNLQKLTIFVNLTGIGSWNQDMTAIDAIHPIMSDSVTFDQATKQWQPFQAGTYRLIIEYDGTNFLLSISNLFG